MPALLVVMVVCIFVFGIAWHDQPSNRPNHQAKKKLKHEIDQ